MQLRRVLWPRQSEVRDRRAAPNYVLRLSELMGVA